MSGTSTNPLIDVERLFGTGLLGDSQAQRLNQVLTDLAGRLDRGDGRVDDVVADLRDTAANAGLDLDQLRDRVQDVAD
jgi:hypothetical protein